jgi:hypothetical protein
MANPNIVNVTSILGKTAVLAITTTPTDIVSNAANSNTVVKINNLVVSNVNSSSAASITASVFRGGTEFKIAHAITIPSGSSLAVIDKATPIYLEESDSLRVTASTNAFLQGVSSYEIIA